MNNSSASGTVSDILLDDFRLRLVTEDDAAFIVELRTNELLSRYLSPTSPDIEAQKAWLQQYKLRERAGLEYYFIAVRPDGERLGLNRLYNFKHDAFELGSWIYKKGLPDAVSIKADLAVRDFAFEQLNFSRCTFEVRKDNRSVIRYHQLFKPKRVREDEQNYFYELDYETYRQSREKLKQIISYGSK